MKEKILLILTFIISFTLYTNTVDAMSECANDTDKLIDGYCCPEGYTSKLITKDKNVICLNKDYSEEEIEKFKIIADGNIFYNNIGGQGINSQVKIPVGKAPSKQCYSCSTTGNYIWSNQEPSNTCLDGIWNIRTEIKEEKECKCSYGFSCSGRSDCANRNNWLQKCEYRLLGEEDKIYVYFDNCQMKIFKNDTDVTERSGNAGTGFIINDITIDQLLRIYNTNGSCPKYLYENHISKSKFLSSTDIHYSLTKKGEPKTYIYQNNKDDNQNPNGNDYNSCEELLDENTVNLINEVMKWIRIFVPILLIGLGVLDFAKATFAKSEDDMKKIREKFIKRIVAAVLVFLAPIFVNLLLELANSVWEWINPNTCIK